MTIKRWMQKQRNTNTKLINELRMNANVTPNSINANVNQKLDEKPLTHNSSIGTKDVSVKLQKLLIDSMSLVLNVEHAEHKEHKEQKPSNCSVFFCLAYFDSCKVLFMLYTVNKNIYLSIKDFQRE
jgi:hypothetical protein